MRHKIPQDTKELVASLFQYPNHSLFENWDREECT